MSFFESLKLVRVFGDYLWVEYLWHAFIMPLTNRNGIRGYSEGGKASCGILLGVLRQHPPDRLRLRFGQVPPLIRVVYGVEEVDVGPIVAAEHHPVLVAAAQIFVEALGDVLPGPLGALALQQGHQVLAVHRLGLLYAEEAQDRWRDVVGRGEEVRALARRLALGVPYHEEGVGELRVEGVRGLACVAMLPEEVAVVGDDHEQGSLHNFKLVRPVDELPEPTVHHGDLRGVERPHPEELAVGEIVVLSVVVVEGFFALVALVVEVDVFLRRVPGLVWIVAVGNQEEWLILPCGLFQHIHGVQEHLGSEPVLLALATLDVGQILAGLITRPEDEVLSSHLLLGYGGGVLVLIPLLAPDPVVDLEAPAEVHMDTELDVGVGHERGAVALFAQYLGQSALSWGDRRPPEVGRAGWPGPHACVDGTPGW